jgi:recombination protein RecA
VIGNHVRVKIVKNKVAPPFREAEFDIMYNQGISKEGDLIDMAAAHEIVQKSGAWYEYKGEKIAQGREAAKKYLAENPKAFTEIAKATVEAAQKAE